MLGEQIYKNQETEKIVDFRLEKESSANGDELFDFFNLLLQIDMRNHPEYYKKPNDEYFNSNMKNKQGKLDK